MDFWATFLPQLLASLAGAAVGVFGVLLGFGLQHRREYAQRLDEAAARVVASSATYAGELEQFTAGAAAALIAKGSGAVHPVANDVSVAVELLRVAAQNRADRELADAIAAAWSSIATCKHASLRISLIGRLGGAVIAWRADNSRRAALDALERIQRDADPLRAA